MVETAEQARRLAARVRYPTPDGSGGVSSGQRGSAFSGRAAGYGAVGGVAHTQLSNNNLLLVVMVESPRGVENAGEIASVPGVDAVFVGPNDLAHAMGHENRWQEAPVQQAMERTIRAVHGKGVCAVSWHSMPRKRHVTPPGARVTSHGHHQRDHPGTARRRSRQQPFRQLLNPPRRLTMPLLQRTPLSRQIALALATVAAATSATGRDQRGQACRHG